MTNRAPDYGARVIKRLMSQVGASSLKALGAADFVPTPSLANGICSLILVVVSKQVASSQ